ncbi:MAG: D-alanyl-D-alanine carboxypeptidase [Lachnospiraceae bacterium]|nr:D-alanyl-D-alanine carboxypeptidase [Lachnospiraceae bacterium]MBR0090538.1 D-alanyl-D-alanine carboxypeptidase [Lachnospiraceae bacterium]
MKCISKKTITAMLLSLPLFLLSCGDVSGYAFPYASYASGMRAYTESGEVRYPAFARELCVTAEDVTAPDLVFANDESAGLFDLTNHEVLYAHRIHERMDPASMTKVLTAIVALENGSLDQVLTASTSRYITDPDAQILEMEAGERMTLHQALHFLLMFSANDVAVMIAEGVAGDEASFVELMNRKCQEIGATNSHFMNPHGLTDAEQYVTPYDMYLIFQYALRFDSFQEIISKTNYKTEYYKADGELKEVEVPSTNAFLRMGTGVSAPVGVTVIGGKTGTTLAAGHCLVLLARDVNGAPYVAVFMHAKDRTSLYENMVELLKKAVK